MNKFIGKQAYQNTATTAPRIEDPHTAITVCLETLLYNLKLLKEMPSSRTEFSNKVASKCLTAIYILQSSLDFDKGREIAENLFKLYEYVKYQVLEKSKKSNTSDMDCAVSIISEISESWKAIK